MDKEIFQNLQYIKKTTRSLPELVADQIDQLIKDNQLRPGSKIPNELELGQLLNVGRGTVREAVKILVSRNVLEIQRGRGTFVADHTGEVVDPLGLCYSGNSTKVLMDLIELRLQLEPWNAEKAAQLATDDELKELRRRCDTVEKLILIQENHLEADLAFHQWIAQCTHNSVAPKLIPIITLTPNLSNYILSNSEERLLGTIAHHRAITQAICSHSPECARQTMQEHLQLNRLAVLESAEIPTENTPASP